MEPRSEGEVFTSTQLEKSEVVMAVVPFEKSVDA